MLTQLNTLLSLAIAKKASDIPTLVFLKFLTTKLQLVF